MSEAPSSGVAALVTADLLSDAAAAGMTVSEDAAQQIAERQAAVSDQETPPAPPAQTADITDSDDDTSFELPNFKPVDLEDLDDDDEPAPQVVAQDDDDDEDEFGYDDDEKRELRKQLKELQKKAEYAERLRLQESHKKWRSKMENQYPLADWDNIAGTSRRSFERAAAESHNRNYTILSPHLEKLEQEWAKLKQAATQEAKQEVQQAWGKPTVGPSASTIGVAAAGDAIEEARKTGSLEKVISAMRRQAGG